MSSQPRRKYYQDFKRNAVLLCAEPDRSVSQVAENLGINKDLLYRWRREYHKANGQYVFPGNGVEALTTDQKRIRELERHSAIRALNKAIMRLRPGKGLMVHSDRDVQYASLEFRKILKKNGFIQSMSRKGNYWELK